MTAHVFHSIYWVDASTEDSISLDLSKIAAHFLPKGAQIPDQQAIVQYVKGSLGSRTKPRLMVVDNMDLPAVF